MDLNMFDDKQIRKVWLNEQWYFSIIDVIEVTTDSKNPRNYWNVLKKRFTEKEKLDIDNIILYAPLLASNGKEYKAEVTNTEGILRIIMSIPSPKAMSLKLWLAQVSQERLDEIENPYKKIPRSIELLIQHPMQQIHTIEKSLIQLQSGLISSIQSEIIDKIQEDVRNMYDYFLKNFNWIKTAIQEGIEKEEMLELSNRKQALALFEKLLNDITYFENERKKKKSAEAVWQEFFENNTWIFGYGLNYMFNTPLKGKKLEQVVAGYNVFNSGKRADALLQSKGVISSLCFGEIKIHTTSLLDIEYRKGCFSISNELKGGIAQVQKTVQKSMKELSSKLEIEDKEGNPTGENVFLYQPKSFLIIGSLIEFKSKNGTNEHKFSSFELFRRNILNPEIITFDELFHRAMYIVKNAEMQ